VRLAGRLGLRGVTTKTARGENDLVGTLGKDV